MKKVTVTLVTVTLVAVSVVIFLVVYKRNGCNKNTICCDTDTSSWGKITNATNVNVVVKVNGSCVNIMSHGTEKVDVCRGDNVEVALNEKSFMTFTAPSKNFSIGGVTGRWTINNDLTPQKYPSATQPSAMLRIHNLTEMNLCLKINMSEVHVPPHSKFNYIPPVFSIALGDTFYDVNGIFENYVMSVPITDLYYGALTSERFSGATPTDHYHQDTTTLYAESHPFAKKV